MPRKRTHHILGQVVTSADIRQWCQSVGARVSAADHAQYVARWGVLEKIARAKARGDFLDLVRDAAERAGVRVRAARRPGVLARLRALPAANDPRF